MYTHLNELLASHTSEYGYQHTRFDTAPTAVATAPPATRDVLLAAQPVPAVATLDDARLRTKLTDHLSGVVCSVCNERLLTASLELSSSLVVFGACRHVVHLGCVSQRLRAGTFDETACARCVLGVGAGSQSSDTTECRNADSILRSFKTRFAQQYSGQSYDKLKATPASHELKRYVLCETASPGGIGTSIASLAPASLRKLAQHIAQRTPASSTSVDSDVDDELRNSYFMDCLRRRRRTFDELMSLKDCNLLQLYRCGVQSFSDLCELGFLPSMHIKGASTADKIPVWQLVDLYGFRFEHMVDVTMPDNFGMPARDVAEFVHMLPPEWALIGATADKFLALQLDARHAAMLNMSVDQWQRYLGLQLAHVVALGLTSRAKFVELMRWEASSELCPDK